MGGCLEWTGGQEDDWVDGSMCGQMDGCVDGQKDDQIDDCRAEPLICGIRCCLCVDGVRTEFTVGPSAHI